MDAKYWSKTLVVFVMCADVTILFSQEDNCRSANTSPQSLDCAFGVSPIAILPLISGVPYIAESDPTHAPYATYLYPNQINQLPLDHHGKGEIIAATLQPLDGNGSVDVSGGKIVVIAEGMSNTRDEMNAFAELLAARQSEVNTKLEFRNLSEGGCDLVCWVENGVGATDPQVQVALVKHSNNRPQQADGTPQQPNSYFPDKDSKRFPQHALTTKNLLKLRVLDLKKKYPNLKLLFITSRSFGGWSCSPSGNDYREPVAFEEGFAVKWLLEDQILGTDPDLAFEGNNPQAPWLAWGPYLWDPTWTEDLYRSDGTHLCKAGADSVAQLWYTYLATESTAWPWFLRNAPTPVELTTFRASSQGADVLLEWTTASELNDYGFEIERREAAPNAGWQTIAFIQGSGTTSAPQTYRYVDANLLPGMYDYRLKQIDFDGSFSYVGVVSVEVNLPDVFTLYQNFPNPFNAQTEIRFYAPVSEYVRLNLYNLKGQIIRRLFDGVSDIGINKFKWDARDNFGSDVSTGVYLYKLEMANGVTTRTLIYLR